MNGMTAKIFRKAGTLPVDSDVDTLGPSSAHRSIHLHPGYVALVVVGGMLGTLARYGIEEAVPSVSGWPLPTLCVNLVGAFALGALLEGLGRRGQDAGRRRIIRLVAGTGFMGAFTTYSTLALEAGLFIETNRIPTMLLYLSLTIIGGVLATALGIWAAGRHHRIAVTRAKNTRLGPQMEGDLP